MDTTYLVWFKTAHGNFVFVRSALQLLEIYKQSTPIHSGARMEILDCSFCFSSLANNNTKDRARDLDKSLLSHTSFILLRS